MTAWFKRLRWRIFGGIEARLMSRCRVCGSSADVISYDPRGVWAYFWRSTVCPAHCPDHDYIYSRYEGHYCNHCGEPPSVEWQADRANP